MKRIAIFILTAMSLVACKQEGCMDESALNFDADADKDCCCDYPAPTPPNFKITIDVRNNNGDALVLNTPFVDGMGRDMQIEQFDFYLSNIMLHSSSGMTMVKDVTLLRYEGNQLEVSGIVPEGDYHMLHLSIGLDSLTNLSDPNSFEDGHALSQSQNTYWTWQQMYRFCMIEGRLDTGNATMDRTFAYHVGENQTYRELTLPINFTKGADDAELNLSIAYEGLFFGNDTINLANNPFCHMSTASNDALGIRFMDNFKAAITN